jgi:lipid-binding SYLF domain-containing protein
MTVRKSSPIGLVLGLVFAVSLIGPKAIAAGAKDPVKETRKVEDAIRVLEEMTGEADKSIPVNLLEDCAGIAILPDVIKAAFIIGGRHGKGVLMIRAEGGGWSNPVFVDLKAGSAGWQAGVQSTDLILVFKTPRSVEKITRGKFTLGADVGIAAGPLGRSAEASTDTELKAEILSYARSRGLYAGLSFQGASISIDDKANANFYGTKGIEAERILEEKGLPCPEAAAQLKKALADFQKE